VGSIPAKEAAHDSRESQLFGMYGPLGLILPMSASLEERIHGFKAFRNSG
jgi:hypothetical protein